jgi:hypothetical protein
LGNDRLRSVEVDIYGVRRRLMVTDSRIKGHYIGGIPVELKGLGRDREEDVAERGRGHRPNGQVSRLNIMNVME